MVHTPYDGVAELGRGQVGDFAAGEADIAAQRCQRLACRHRLTSRKAAASRRSDSRGDGMYSPRKSTNAMQTRTGAPVETPSLKPVLRVFAAGSPWTTDRTVAPMPTK